MNRLREFGTTIFAEMSGLADRTGAVNLGQGYPDTDGPDEIKQAAIRAIHEGHNQYPPGPGIATLRQAVARHQDRFWGLEYDPDGEVLITAGATEALAAALLALCGPGDEVVLFEPWYDAYAAGVALAGATRRSVTLRAEDGYGFDPSELAAAVTTRTRAIVVNSPHNPTGKVFTEDELAQVRDLCVEHDLVCITDEVYEHITFDGRRHVPIATLDGMRERTVTISSAAKTFSFTGWKVGWACSTRPLVADVRTVKQFLTYVNAAPFQHAVAEGLSVLDDGYYAGLAADLQAKRDVLCGGLEANGFKVLLPDGTYFATADIRPLGFEDGLAFCRETLPGCGVVAVPNVVFYDHPDEGRHLVRFAFCKRQEVLEEAVARLRQLVKVAAVQHDIVWEDPAANLNRLAPMIAEAAVLGARFVLLSEMFATGFSMNTAVTAEAAVGPTTTWMQERAATCDVWVGGTIAQAPLGQDGGRPSNMFVLAGPDGALHRYAKIHTFTHAGEHEHFAAGDQAVTVDVEGLRITPFVCYDLRFADEFWAAGPGTDMFVVPANWPASRREQWRTLARARAIENQCYLLGVNRVGEGGGLAYAGDSCVIDPIGRTLVEASETETILVADVDPSVVAAARERFAFLADRRT